jgi:ferritin-like metal-binding protein YciE
MQDLKEFMIDQLNELYNAEVQLKIILEKMAFKTSNENLRHQFELISKQMESQTSKLDKVFSFLGDQKKDRHSYIMEAIGQEVQDFIEKNPGPELCDSGFIALVQKAKHYEIAMYGTLRDYAHEIDNPEAENLLSEILSEEKINDKQFTDKARGGINQRASDKDSLPRRFASTRLKDQSIL